jgi:hypothetical protein
MRYHEKYHWLTHKQKELLMKKLMMVVMMLSFNIWPGKHKQRLVTIQPVSVFSRQPNYANPNISAPKEAKIIAPRVLRPSMGDIVAKLEKLKAEGKKHCDE